MSQLPLPIDLSAAAEPALLLGEPNRAARALLADWRRWPGPAAILSGPSRSGRSLLAGAFRAESGGEVIDDAERIAETELFHAWNRAQASGLPLLLVAAAPPPIWSIALPDLRTRLATAAQATILPPDEPLIAALVASGLARAGTAYAPDVPDFLAIRLPRCYQAVEKAVARLNHASLSTSRKISVALTKVELTGAGLLEG